MRLGRKQIRRVAAMIAMATVGAIRADGATPASWLNAADGSWNVGSNWSTNPIYPNNASPNLYDATIGIAGVDYTVALNSDITVNSVTLASANTTLLVAAGGSLTASTVQLNAGTFALNGGVIFNANISGSGGTLLAEGNGVRSTLVNATLNSDAAITSGASIGVSGPLTLNGNLHFIADPNATESLTMTGGSSALNGTGTILFDGSGTAAKISGLAVGSGITIRTGSGGGEIDNFASTLQNAGTISAQTSGQTITVSDLMNTGTLISMNNATLNLTGTIPIGGLGFFNTNGGTIGVAGTLQNSGNTLHLNGTSNNLTLFGGGTISGGSIVTSSGAQLLVGQTRGTLDGVTLTGDVSVGSNFAILSIANGLTLSAGTIHLNADSSTASSLDSKSNTSISGSGSILFEGTSSTNTVGAAGVTMTFGSGVTISTNGQGGSITNAINQGIIASRTAGKVVTLSNVLNQGQLLISSGAGAELIDTSPVGALGNFNVANGGSLGIRGTLLNTGNTLTLNGTGNTVTMDSGTISGGTINIINGAQLLFSPARGNLDGVTFSGDMFVEGSFSFVQVEDGLTLNNGTIHLDANSTGNAALLPLTATSVGGTGTIILGGSAGGSQIGGAGGVVTLGPSINVWTSGQSGLIDKVANQGTIASQTANQGIKVTDSFTNSGTLIATNGGTIAFSNPELLTNLASGVFTGGHWYVSGNSTINFGQSAITTNAADVSLQGAGSRFDAINGLTANNGTFTVGGGRAFTLADGFSNTGTIEAQSGGQFNLGSGSNTGTMIADAGGTINVTGNFTFTNTSNILGGGVLQFSSIQNFNGTLSGGISLGLAGSTTFGPTANVMVAGLFIGSSANTASAGAMITVGGSGLNLSGNTSPTLELGAGTTPARLTLGGNVRVSGNTTGGLAQIATGGTGAVDGTLDLGNAMRIFTIQQGPTSPDLLITAFVTNGGINKMGGGAMAMSHSNDYAGGTTLSDGTLEASNPNALGAGTVTFSGGTLSLRTDSGAVAVPNALTTSTTGSLFINVNPLTSGSDSFTVGTMTIGSTLRVSGSGTLVVNHATLTNNLNVDGNAATTINTPLTGSYSIQFGGGPSGAGINTLGGAGDNTYTGTTYALSGLLNLNKTSGNAIPADLQILGGQVQEFGSNQIIDSSNITIAAGTLNLVGVTETVGPINLSSSGGIVGSGTLTTPGITRTPPAVAGNVIARSGSLTINGTASDISGNTILAGTWGTDHGTLTMNSVGVITVNQGTILLNNGSFTNLGALTSNTGSFLLDGVNYNSTAALNNTGTIAMDSAASLAISQPITLFGGTIVGGTVNASGSGQVIVNTFGAMNGVSLNSSLAVGTPSQFGNMTMTDGMTFLNGSVMTIAANSYAQLINTQTIGGTGQIAMSPASAMVLGIFPIGITSTFSSGITVHGAGQISDSNQPTVLINQGTFAADISGQTLSIIPHRLINNGTMLASGGASLTLGLDGLSGGTFINNGTINVTNSTLTLNGAWTNSATFSANNSTVNLGGTFTQTSLGTFNRTGGTVYVTGTISGGVSLSNTTGSWILDTGTVLGGSINATGGATFSDYIGNLDGVTLNANVSVSNTMGILDGLIFGNNSVISPGNGVLVQLLNSESIGGTGQFALAASNLALGSSVSAGTFTFGSGVTVHGFGNLNNASFPSTLTNNGTIAADVNNQTLQVFLGKLTNAGSLLAINGGVLTLNATTLINNGTISAVNSTLNLNGAWTNAATLSMNNSIVNLGGSFTQASLGNFIRSGGSVNLTGTVSGGLSLNNATGSWLLSGGTILGGTISESGAAQLTTQNGTLDGTTLNTNLPIVSGWTLTVVDGLTIQSGGALTVNPSSIVSLANNETINGPGQIVLMDNFAAPSYITLGSIGGTQTFGPALTVHGQGNIQNAFNPATLINQGSIVADTSGRSISILPTTFTNTGTLLATGEGILTLSPTNFTNTGTIATASGGVIRYKNAFTNAGSINLSSGGMICDYSTTSPLPTIVNQIKTGYASGAWTGPGINSAAAAIATIHRTAIGYAEASALGITGSGTFLGQPVDNTTVLVRYVYAGDANLDGTVNSSDFGLLAANFGATGKSWSAGDYNYDGVVNALDFNALASNYGQMIGSSADVPDGQLAPYIFNTMEAIVPEPSDLMILVGISVAYRRHRHSRETSFHPDLV